ncbi:CcoQ/FixQ family Cbb3-type cytochrome c oxidase assembly chaperone [bacterium]|nr:CcoQ/FixQ family Cbb3-type cytochrome c oxidase assembly chaperone [bacterium]
MSHDLALLLAKSFGLFYLIVFSVLIVLHTYRPSRKAQLDQAARAILNAEDRPCP